MYKCSSEKKGSRVHCISSSPLRNPAKLLLCVRLKLVENAVMCTRWETIESKSDEIIVINESKSTIRRRAEYTVLVV